MIEKRELEAPISTEDSHEDEEDEAFGFEPAKR